MMLQKKLYLTMRTQKWNEKVELTIQDENEE